MSQISSEKPPVSGDRAPQPGPLPSFAAWLAAFWKFSRPHTIIGTSLSVIAMFAIVIALNGLELAVFVSLRPILVFGFTLLACLCGNVYIVGLNQLEDVGIDQINKPHLPLASGEFSRRGALRIVAITGQLALVIAIAQGWYLFGMVALSLLIGTAYSLPPIRLKRFPLWASLCIFSVRGVIVNLGLFLHFSQQFGVSTQIPSPVWALTLFIVVFTLAIALFKDIPDLEGDRRFQINTFTIRLGTQAVFNLSLAILTVCYVGMSAAGLILPSVNRPFLLLSHLIPLAALWWFGRQVNLDDKRAIARFYQFIWKLFFLEYGTFAIACLLN